MNETKMNDGQNDYPDRTGCFAVFFGALTLVCALSLMLNVALILRISHDNRQENSSSADTVSSGQYMP